MAAGNKDNYQHCHHVMKVDPKQDRSKDLSEWLATSKLAKRAGIYKHQAGGVLTTSISQTPFPVSPKDLGKALGPFPGYPGTLIPSKCHPN